MKKLLVLGAGGFIGRRVVESLSGRYEVVPVVSDAAGKNPDLSNYDEMLPILAESRPEVVLNLAGKSYHMTQDDSDIYESNALVQLNLHEAADRLGLGPKLIFCSSSSVYESSAAPVDENAVCRPVNSYAKSKYLQERVALSYHPRQHVVIARLFNVIGPFQNENFFIPTLISRVLSYRNGESSEVALKTLNAMRDFIYIDDVCGAIDVLARQGEGGQVYNVCSGKGVSIEAVIEIIKKLLGISDLPVRTSDDHVKEGINHQVGSSEKLKGLGWSPAFTIEESLKTILKVQHGC